MTVENETIDQWRECQEAICSFAFTNPRAFERVCSIVSEQHFRDRDLRTLYVVCGELSEAVRNIDLQSIIIEMRKRGALETIGGIPFISKISLSGYTSAHADYYASEIQRLSKLDRIRQAAETAFAAAGDVTSDPSKILAAFESDTLSITTANSGNDFTSMADASKIAIQRQRDALKSGVPLSMLTGFPSLDDAAGGFHRGQLVLLSGRTFSGKTTLALNFACHFGRKRRPTLFCCLEMKDFELAERVLCADANIALSQWATSDFVESDFQRLEQSAKEQANWPVYVSKSVFDTPTSIRARAKIAKAHFGGLDLLVVDHLQRITPRNSREERYRQLVETASSMKNLAQELDCVVMLLSQLKNDSDSEPTDASYSEAKNILQEADQAYMLHRGKNEPFGKLIVNKNRKGCSTEIKLDFEGRFQRFTDPQSGSNAWVA